MSKPFTFNQWHTIVSFVDSKFPDEPMTSERQRIKELDSELFRMSRDITPQKRIIPALHASWRRIIRNYLNSNPPAPQELIDRTREMIEGYSKLAEKLTPKRRGPSPADEAARDLIMALLSQSTTQNHLSVSIEAYPSAISSFTKNVKKSLTQNQYSKLAEFTDEEVRRLRFAARAAMSKDPLKGQYLTAKANYLAQLADQVDPEVH